MRKMLKMRLRPGLRPGPRWGSLQRSSTSPVGGFGGGQGVRREWEINEEGREGKVRKGGWKSVRLGGMSLPGAEWDGRPCALHRGGASKVRNNLTI